MSQVFVLLSKAASQLLFYVLAKLSTQVKVYVKCPLFYGENYSNNSYFLSSKKWEHLATLLLVGTPCLNQRKQGIHQAEQEKDARDFMNTEKI